MDNKQINVLVGGALRMLRIKAGYTQAQLTKLCNERHPEAKWFQTDISRLEVGSRFLTPWYAMVFGSGLGMTSSQVMSHVAGYLAAEGL